MPYVIPIPNTLSAGARQALTDMLHAGVEATSLLDTGPDSGWTENDALAAAQELDRAGFGRVDGTAFYLDVEPRSIPTLETDLLDDIAPAVDALQAAWDETCRLPFDEHPAAAPNPFGITSRGTLYNVLLVLLLAAHELRGEIKSLPATVQFPLVAQSLARQLLSDAGLR